MVQIPNARIMVDFINPFKIAHQKCNHILFPFLCRASLTHYKSTAIANLL